MPASLAGTWRAGGAKPANMLVATKSDYQMSLWPSGIFSDIYSSSWGFAGRWRERGWFYFVFSHGVKHKIQDKNGNKNHSMSELERILNSICFKPLLSGLQNKLKLRE